MVIAIESQYTYTVYNIYIIYKTFRFWWQGIGVNARFREFQLKDIEKKRMCCLDRLSLGNKKMFGPGSGINLIFLTKYSIFKITIYCTSKCVRGMTKAQFRETISHALSKMSDQHELEKVGSVSPSCVCCAKLSLAKGVREDGNLFLPRLTTNQNIVTREQHN